MDKPGNNSMKNRAFQKVHRIGKRQKKAPKENRRSFYNKICDKTNPATKVLVQFLKPSSSILATKALVSSKIFSFFMTNLINASSLGQLILITVHSPSFLTLASPAFIFLTSSYMGFTINVPDLLINPHLPPILFDISYSLSSLPPKHTAA